MPEEKHHKYSPSQLHRIMRCPGSVARCEQLPPEEESPYAAEGTLLHAHMVEAMDLWPNPYIPDTENPEHRQLLLDCVEYVGGIIAGLKPPWFMLNDQKVKMGRADCEGTLDLALWDIEALHIIDFKFGGGIEVSPIKNEQLMAYACGVLEHQRTRLHCTWAQTKVKHEDTQVLLHIVQPRLNNYSGWQTTAKELDQFEDKLVQIIYDAENSETVVPGPEQCKWCLARGVCKERLEAAYNDAVVALSSVTDSPVSPWKMTNEELAKILATQGEVKRAFSAIEKYLYSQLLAGQEVPGFKLTAGRSSRKWKEGVNAFTLAEALGGVEETDLMSVELKSPAQVEKQLNAAGKRALKEFYDVTEGAFSIAADSSNKPAIPNAAAHSFRDVIDCEVD